MNYWRAAGGAALGVSTVAIAPFTGKGSVLGKNTLQGSLCGWRALLLATSAGAAGAYAASHNRDLQQALQRFEAKAAAMSGNHIRLAS